MPAIQHRDGEQIDQRQVDRKQRREGNEGRNPHIRHLTGHLRDAQWPAQILCPPAARNHLPHPNQGLPGDIHRMGHAGPNRAEWIKPFKNRQAGCDAEHAKPVRRARQRCGHNLDLLFTPRHQDFNGLTGAGLDIALQRFKPLYRLAVQGHDPVPRRQPGARGG